MSAVNVGARRRANRTSNYPAERPAPAGAGPDLPLGGRTPQRRTHVQRVLRTGSGPSVTNISRDFEDARHARERLVPSQGDALPGGAQAALL